MTKIVLRRLAFAVVLALLAMVSVSAEEAAPSRSPEAQIVPLQDFLLSLSCQGEAAATLGPIPSIVPCHCGEAACLGKSTGARCFTYPEGREGECVRIGACSKDPAENNCYCHA